MASPEFNPDIPVDDSLIVAHELRDQFNSLNDLFLGLSGDVMGRCLKPEGVDPLAQTISNPPTQAQVQAIQDKLNELLAALNSGS